MMWIVIFGLVIAATTGGIAYLVSRFSKFSIVHRIAGDYRKLRLGITLPPLLILFSLTGTLLGPVNAIICLLHLVAFWMLSDLIFLIIKKFRKKEYKIYYSGILAVLVTAVYLPVGWYLANNVWRTDYLITTDKEIDELRLVYFADSHIGTTFHADGFAKYLAEIQQVEPDVVLIVGDFVDDDTSRDDMIGSCRALGELRTTYGVYFAFGNHDKGYYEANHRGYNGDDLIAELEKNGVTVLQDESVLIDDRFYIIGRQDLSENTRGQGRATMQELMEPLDEDKYTIVLDHQPHEYKAQAKAQADLVLSGHTHGGQLLPITYVGEWIGQNDRTYGHERRETTDFIVTSGISDWAIKFKTGCRSEYVVIDVQEVPKVSKK